MTTESDSTAGFDSELAQYRWLLDHIPAEIGIFDLSGRFLFNTPSGVHDPELREWLIGKTHEDFCRRRDYPMEIADRRQRVIDQCIESKQSVTFEELWTDKEGRSRYYVRTFTPVIGPAGEPTHVIGYGHEITELKKAEDDLRLALAAVEAMREQLDAQNAYLREEIRLGHDFGDILGESHAIRNVLEAIATVAATDANVLIVGETGTGKELVARALHESSARADQPLVKVNCAAVPRELFESEFFGHVRGAFTGAVRDRTGRFELADRGTLFLDEVAEIPLDVQAKLLRVLEEGELERVGEERTRTVDVRIIAATNRDLKAEADERRFRLDLYYRLNVFPIEVAPLRERGNDIRLLAEHFLARASQQFQRPIRALPRHDVRRLLAYDWPGNVRELRNVIERAVLVSRTGPLRLDLPDERDVRIEVPHEDGSGGATIMRESEIRRFERENTQAALRLAKGRLYGPHGAATLLGTNPSTLASRVKKWGLERSR